MTEWIRRLFRLPTLEEMEAEAVKTTDNIRIRKMAPADVDAVLAVSGAADDEPLDREDVCDFGSGPPIVALVGEWYGGVRGYCFAEVQPAGIDVLRIAVEPDAPIYPIAGRLLDELLGRLSPGRCLFIRCPAHNVSAQNYYRAIGFKARGFCRKSDCFLFTYAKQP